MRSLSKKKKVVFLIQNGVGGAERMAFAMAKMLPKDSFRVTFVIVLRGGGTSIKEFIPEGYSVVDIPDGNAIKIMWNLFKTVKRLKPDIVFSSAMYLSTKILPFKWLLRGTRFVIRCENYMYTYSEAQIKRIKFTYPKADAIIAQTEEMAQELYEIGINEQLVHVLHNPIDTDYINEHLKDSTNPYPQNGNKVIVASGRFAYQKGFDMLAEAFAKLAIDDPNIDLYILGDYDYEDGAVLMQIKTIAKRNGIKDRIHCVGFKKNPYPYIQYADCFVLSSRWEGLPNVLVESLFLGTPVAAFACIPIISRIIEEGKTGYTAKADDVEGLAESIKKTIKLGRVKTTYKPASKEDIIRIIDSNTGFLN